MTSRLELAIEMDGAPSSPDSSTPGTNGRRVVEIISGRLKGGPMDWILHRLYSSESASATEIWTLPIRSDEAQWSNKELPASFKEVTVTRLRRNLAESSPDVIVVHNPRELILYLMISSHRRRTTPLVLVIHSAHLLSRPMLRPLLKRALRLCESRIQMTVAVSSAAARGEIGKLFNNVRVIHCSYPIGEVPSRQPTINRIASIGRLVPGKNHQILIHAAAALAPKLRDDNWEIHIIGEGPQRQEIERAISLERVDDLVHCVGHIPRIWETLNEYQILAVPSSTETGPLTVPQALAQGTRVLARDVGRCGEWLSGDANSRLIPFDASEAEFIETLDAMVSDQPLSLEDRQLRRVAFLANEDVGASDAEFYAALAAVIDQSESR